MRIVIGILIVLVSLIGAVPASASSFGLSPVSVSAELMRGESKSFNFTVIGYSGLVDISVEDMPATVIPSFLTVADGVPISVTVRCNDDAPSISYNGRIVFLAKGGGNILAGIKAICNLTVAGASTNMVLTTIVTGGGSGGSSGGGHGWDSQSVPYTPPDWASIFPSMNQPQSSSPSSYYIPPAQETNVSPPVVGNPPQNIAPVTSPTVQGPSSPPAMDKAVWAGIAFWAIAIGLFVWFLSWLVDRRRKPVQ